MTQSSTHIEPRLRADLEWSEHAEDRWVARDPLTASFYSFNAMERMAAVLMTGTNGLGEMLQQLRMYYPTAGIDRNWLLSFVAKLRVHHLLMPIDLKDNQRIVQAGRSRSRQGTLQFLLSPLAIRVPLGNPTPILNYLRRPAWILFHPRMVVVWVMAGVMALFLVLREFLSGPLGLSVDLRSIQGDRWLILLGCYLCAKSLHELGHALACVQKNTECREIGLMFLCLAPCFYCDTTDSWKLRSKWQRAGIAAAGMYVELILATLAALVWLLTKDGTPHFVAASVMVVCSLGTIFINSNPLLKYDGYYILSDLWGVPNLADQSREAFRALVRKLMYGASTAKSSLDANVFLLATYAICSTMYRCTVLCVILWVAWAGLVPRGLGFLAIGITLAMLSGMLLGQIRSLRSLFRDVWAQGNVKWIRMLLCLAFGLGSLLLLLTMPIPTYVRARAISDYQDKLPLFASQTAELVAVAPTGVPLKSGRLLIGLDSPESQLELQSLGGEMRLVEKELEQLRMQQTFDPAASYLIPVKVEKLAELKTRTMLLEREIASLTITAPQDGILLAAAILAPDAPSAWHDDRFTHSSLNPSRLGRVAQRSELLGWFTSKRKLTLTAIVDQESVKLLKLGMEARIQWDSELSQIAIGRVVRIATTELRETPAELIGDPMLVSSRNARGTFSPDAPHYEVSLELSGSHTWLEDLLLRGAPATIQISTTSKTLIELIVHALQRNLKPIY